MKIMHLSLEGRKNTRWLHLCHMENGDLLFHAFVDGNGLEDLRDSIRRDIVPVNELAGIFQMTYTAEILCQLQEGVDAGLLDSGQCALLHDRIAEYAKNHMEEHWAVKNSLLSLFALSIVIKNDKAMIKGFDDMRISYWYTH